MEKAKTVKGPGNRRNMGPRPKLNNPLKTLSRLIKYMGKYYGIHMVIVVLCIIANVFANVNGTWFMKALVDEYILPMIKEGSNDFGPLLKAMIRVGGFYGVGVIASLIQAEIMVFVTQGTLKHLRDDMFNHIVPWHKTMWNQGVWPFATFFPAGALVLRLLLATPSTRLHMNGCGVRSRPCMMLDYSWLAKRGSVHGKRNGGAPLPVCCSMTVLHSTQ